MRAIDLSKATWRRSSYSNSDGGECVEVSDDFLNAAAWHRSSYSNSDGGNCVEVAHNLPLVPVRDSKDTARTPLVFAGTAWAVFVEHIKS
ncbi:DUF397 domain-containing protein [Streptomyces sp. HUAS TT20]|uniref:DUF397 domain-containing protein n=1 Tax=Streptomyces sp. HUAS TT20 TaxID=3447509 RepID=UPI0021DA7105|nr:DUF397 domain-containing protein [Streptomyces sp. HUAS 15-9]UXY28415.1 DUF397 domain-containing protein [Streptomyces sp. HUAS 15-9]